MLFDFFAKESGTHSCLYREKVLKILRYFKVTKPNIYPEDISSILLPSDILIAAVL